MAHFRAYLDKRKGGDHSRVIDVELPEYTADLNPSDLSMALSTARHLAEQAAKQNETVGDVVLIHLDGDDANGLQRGTIPRSPDAKQRLLLPGDPEWRTA